MGSDTQQRKIAVIGAGISGVSAAAHIKKEGFQVTVFERAPVAGGVWVYNERKPSEPYYPSMNPSKGEFILRGDYVNKGTLLDEPSFTSGIQVIVLQESPCYSALKNNVPTPLMQTTLSEWPPETADYVGHEVIEKYIQDISKQWHVHESTMYSTAVVGIQKKDKKWEVQYVSSDDCQELHPKLESFDVVIVASGHYHAPRIPDLPGLAKLKALYPNRIRHSKSYRTTKEFVGKTVLLIGAGVSSTDIAKELGAVGCRVLQSSRNGLFDLSSSLLPKNGHRVGEIESFELQDVPSEGVPELRSDEPLPIQVHLKSGHKLDNIDEVIICTGYHITYPFLRHLHSDNTLVSEADRVTLVTDGTQVHNLHNDIWYIPDTSLIFIGVPYHVATFSLFDHQAVAVATVLAGRAELPSEEVMREEYELKLTRKQPGRTFNSLKDEEIEYVNHLLGWVNESSAKAGFEPIPGYTEKWHKALEQFKFRLEVLFDKKHETGLLTPPAEGATVH